MDYQVRQIAQISESAARRTRVAKNQFSESEKPDKLKLKGRPQIPQLRAAVRGIISSVTPIYMPKKADYEGDNRVESHSNNPPPKAMRPCSNSRFEKSLAEKITYREEPQPPRNNAYCVNNPRPFASRGSTNTLF